MMQIYSEVVIVAAAEVATTDMFWMLTTCVRWSKCFLAGSLLESVSAL